MAGLSLKCGDCGVLLKSVEEAQEHAELTSHSNFSESTEAVLNLVCTTCGKPCRSKTESSLHKKRTGHSKFVDKTSDAAKPISLEVPKPSASAEPEEGVEAGESSQSEEMVVPEVDKNLLGELEAMGFPKARATRALLYSGNVSLEVAVNWIVEHDNDPDIDEMPMERIRAGKELLEAKRIEEENERKRLLALRKAEKEEEKRAREKIRQKLEEDKAERRRKLGLAPEEPASVKPPTAVVEEKKISLPVRPATKAERMRDCLRSLKQNHKDDDAKVKRAFQTLLTYVGNVAKNPNEEKFRKIRLNNPSFQERVGSVEGRIEFLELCGFEKIEGGEFLFLRRDKVGMPVLNTAGAELNSAIVNPFFGVL
ncbi:UBX domain-containing protein 4-like [Telopea speciosissima]|uniref:UBX domain-containing protein 4-like n=1 Tax=Telopea speciosissima TaxID=54955 RepID=UPI001CC76ABC|nr:UBX domain-containing protein 4-like [Telopea speciosissima]